MLKLTNFSDLFKNKYGLDKLVLFYSMALSEEDKLNIHIFMGNLFPIFIDR